MVSIILPTYNRAALAEKSIGSVLQQTFIDFELIVVDDGSDDNTQQIVLAFNDERVRYFKVPHKGRIGNLKNFAIEKSNGDFIAFIDSDDLWKKDKLERQMKFFSDHPSIGFCITDVTTFRNDEVLIPRSYKLQNTTECVNIFDRLIDNQLLVYNPTLIIRKECISKVGYFEDTMMCGGHQFVMRLAYFFEAGIIYDTLVLRRVHDSNISELKHEENYIEYINTFQFLYDHKMLGRKYLLKAKSNAYFKLANIERRKGKSKNARKNYWRSFAAGIWFPRFYAGLLSSLKR